MTRSMDHMGDQLQWFNLQAQERWSTLQENGYENGGICRTSETMPFANHDNTKMLFLNVSVDDHYEVHGGAFECPAPLYEKLNEAVELIREIVAEYKASPSESGSDSASLTRPVSSTFSSRLPDLRNERASRPGLVELGRSTNRLPATTITPGTKRRASMDEDEGQPLKGEDGENGMLSSAVVPNKTANGVQEEPPDESDWEARAEKNMRAIKLKDKPTLRLFYAACFERIQQTACRQIAQVFVKVVHPKKQTLFPYNGNKRTTSEKQLDKSHGKIANKANTESEAPSWWPEGVPHREPAHMKTPDRMKLLLHILCDLRNEPGTGPNENGVCAADLQKATNQDVSIQKMSKRVRHWLNEIYTIRKADEQDVQGTIRDEVSVHWPSNKRVRNKNDPRRRKTDENREDGDRTAQFEEAPDALLGHMEPLPLMKRDGNLYDRSDSDSERDNAEAWSEYHCADVLPSSQSDPGALSEINGSVSRMSRRLHNFPSIAASMEAASNPPPVTQGQSYSDRRVSFANSAHMNAAAMAAQPAAVDYPSNSSHYPPSAVSSALENPFQAQGATMSVNGQGGVIPTGSLPPTSPGTYFSSGDTLGALPVRPSHGHIETDRNLPGLQWTTAPLVDPYNPIVYPHGPLTTSRSGQWEHLPQVQVPAQMAASIMPQEVSPIALSHGLIPSMQSSSHKDGCVDHRAPSGRSMDQRTEGLQLAPLGPGKQIIQGRFQHLPTHQAMPRYLSHDPRSSGINFGM